MAALRSLALATLLGGTVLLAGSSDARAQTMKEALKEHVREGVERSKERKRKKRETSQRAEQRVRGTQAPLTEEHQPTPAPEQAPPEPAPPEPARPDPDEDALPIRVFGKNAQFDLSVGFGYHGWFPQQYRAADVEIGSYMTGSIELKAKLFGWLSLRRGRYESNQIAGPRTEQAVVAAQVGQYAPKAVWLLGILGVPISKAWEPQVRYEARAFETRATPTSSVCVVDRSAPEDAIDCPGTRGELKITSSFETFVAGVRYDASKSGSPVLTQHGTTTPPLFFGIGLMQYRKPYQLTLDGFTLDDYLFDARFRGAGLAFATEFAGGIDEFFGEVDAQLGLGEVSLTDTLTLNELVPDGGLIGYLQGTATVGYRWAFIHGPPTLIFVPVIKAGGATFFMIDTHGDDDEGVSPTLNWDFLWSVQATLLIAI
jgi:hypothetical protein